MASKTIDFEMASPYEAEARKLDRRQRMAELLQAQALAPIERASYKGIEAPISPLAGLAKVLQSYMSGREMSKIGDAEDALERMILEDQKYDMGLAQKILAEPGFPAQKARPYYAGTLDKAGNEITPSDEKNQTLRTDPKFMGPGQGANGRPVLFDEQGNIPAMDQIDAGFMMPYDVSKFRTPEGQAFMLAKLGEQQKAQVVKDKNAALLEALKTAQNNSTSTPSADETNTESIGDSAGGIPMSIWLQVDPTGKNYIKQRAEDHTERNDRLIEQQKLKQKIKEWDELSAIQKQRLLIDTLKAQDEGYLVDPPALPPVAQPGAPPVAPLVAPRVAQPGAQIETPTTNTNGAPRVALSPVQQRDLRLSEEKTNNEIKKQNLELAKARLELLKTNYQTMKAVESGLKELKTSFEGFGDGGVVSGSLPPVTEGAITAESGIDGFLPILKDIFRIPGEGTFTEGDQEVLEGVMPTRRDTAALRTRKYQYIKDLVDLKLGFDRPINEDDAAISFSKQEWKTEMTAEQKYKLLVEDMQTEYNKALEDMKN